MAVYIASEVPLRTLPFDADKPAFHVVEVRPFDEIVKKHFSKPYVYYVGIARRMRMRLSVRA